MLEALQNLPVKHTMELENFNQVGNLQKGQGQNNYSAWQVKENEISFNRKKSLMTQ